MATRAAKRKVGRPTLYTPELAAKICDLIRTGLSERRICEKPGMPDRRTLLRWKDENPEFCRQSARAREESAENFREEALSVARATSEFADSIANGVAKTDEMPHGYVEAKKLLVQELNREAALRDDSRFGDRKTVKLDATPDGTGMAEVYAKMLEAQKDG